MEKQEVALIGAIGADEVGRTQLSILEAEGINISGIQTFPNEESGQAYIIIDERGQNCIHTYFGANRRILPQLLQDPTILKLIKAAEVIVIMDPPLSTTLKVAELGKVYGALVIWDPGIHCALGIDTLLPALALTDYFILNQIEFATLLNTKEPRQIGQRVAAANADIAVIAKQGSQGCTLIKDQGEAISHIPSIDLFAVGMKAINTVGCGDAFIGAFAAAKVKGQEDKTALIQANYAGAYKATREETRGSPTRDELVHFINHTHDRSQKIV